MVPFIETIKTKEELIEACKKGFEDYENHKISKNDFCMFFGFTHGEAITKFYPTNYGQLLIDGGWNSGSEAYFSGGINAWKNLKDGKYIFPPIIHKCENASENTVSPVQIIYFGSPGTGKSHEVATYLDKLIDNGKLKKENIFRTTFHPDYDFASFVGTYKPMTNGDAIRYEFEPQVFTEAYVKAWKDTNEQVYLVIEEINRGNCAQIFGDLFQLLDRKNGFSEYPIKADASLRKYLEREDVLGNDSDGINDGKLKLPANFNIIATMNTSDQSLFPMDSAFKRRWNWKYVPTKIVESEHKDRSLTVCNPDKDSDVLVNYNFKSRKLKLDQYEYNWSAFLQKVNSKIFEVTRSDDKKLGFWFLKPQAQNSEDLSVSDFVSKVVFYLWSDVFKDVGPKASNPFTITDKDGKMTVMSFNQFFDENTGQENIGVIHTFMGNLGLIPDFNEEIVDALDVSASSATQSENIIENQNE